jgi:hypothetical protein
MKCFNHSEKDAVATCMGCGKALCHECCPSPAQSPFVCSDQCREKVAAEERTLALIRRKTITQNRVSGAFCIMGSMVFGLFGVFNLTLPRGFLPLAIFMIATCIAFIIAGVKYLRVGKEDK